MRTFLLEIWEGLRIAGQAIWTHKMRSVLTTLGIIIGIAAVTAMATIINGIDRQFEASLSSLGADVLYVRQWPLAMGPGSAWWEYVNRPNIQAELADVIEERARYVAAATPVIDTDRIVSYEERTLTGVEIEGSGADYARIRRVELAQGRFYNALEARNADNVAVIGSDVAEKLFPVANPLGKDIRVDGRRVRVIGVLMPQGGPAGSSSADQEVKIPFKTYDKFFGTRDWWADITIMVKAASTELMDEAAGEVTGVVRVARGLEPMEENNFEVDQQQDVREMMAPVKAAIFGVGIFLTALSLLVGGIGVMNIMFVSVKERTREIGIRKAVGARRRAILGQFLIEAVIVCLIGGAIGVLISSTLTGVIRAVLGISAFLPVSTIVLSPPSASVSRRVEPPPWSSKRCRPVSEPIQTVPSRSSTIARTTRPSRCRPPRTDSNLPDR